MYFVIKQFNSGASIDILYIKLNKLKQIHTNDNFLSEYLEDYE